jgi:RNA polymerase sigma-70 factor, ECF subfamily
MYTLLIQENRETSSPSRSDLTVVPTGLQPFKSLAGNAAVDAHEGLSDDDLYTAVRNGNRRAFEVLYTRLYDEFCTFAASYLNNRHDCEDAVQQAFLDVWRSPPKPNGELLPYMLRIVRNKCLDIRRKRKFVLSDTMLDMTADPGEGPHNQAESQDRGRTIHECLTQLTEKEREIIELREIQKLTLKETAIILGVSIVTVHRRVLRAKGKLGAILRNRGVEL